MSVRGNMSRGGKSEGLRGRAGFVFLGVLFGIKKVIK